jgi:hypothetical protein
MKNVFKFHEHNATCIQQTLYLTKILHDEHYKYYLEIYTKSFLVEENKHIYNKKYSSYV